MLKFAAILVLALTVSSLTAVAVSTVKKSPASTPTQGTGASNGIQNVQGQTGTNEVGKIKPNTPQPHTVDPSTGTDESRQQASANLKIQEMLAIFTGLLVVVGFLQVGAMCWQAWLLYGTRVQMEKTVAAAQTSADAAKDNADAAYTSAQVAAGVSIPTLVVHDFGLNDIEIRGWIDNKNARADNNLESAFQTPRIRIQLKNYGQTPAFLKEWSCNITCEELPRTPDYKIATPVEKIVIEGGTIHDLYWSAHTFSAEDSRAIAKKEKKLVAYGRIRYGDVFGANSHSLKFCETLVNIDKHGNVQWSGEKAPAVYRNS